MHVLVFNRHTYHWNEREAKEETGHYESTSNKYSAEDIDEIVECKVHQNHHDENNTRDVDNTGHILRIVQRSNLHLPSLEAENDADQLQDDEVDIDGNVDKVGWRSSAETHPNKADLTDAI